MWNVETGLANYKLTHSNDYHIPNITKDPTISIKFVW
jgi:hypothetical protein